MKTENLVLISLLLLFIVSFFSRISGYFVNFSLNISVRERKDARILLDYKPMIDITERQNITAEVINTGSVTIEEELFIRIYYYNRSLKPIGEYFDSLRVLKPGERSNFRIVFVPNTVGTYYIQAKAKYDGRTTETWGRFDVLVYPIYEYVIQQPQKIEKETPLVVYLKPPKIEIYVNDTYNAYKGGEVLIPILVKNLGEREAFELKSYISYPSGLEVSLSPPFVRVLEPNQTSSFILRVFIPLDFSEGLYELDFALVGNETKANKIIKINVTKFVPDIYQDYKEKILSLEILASEVEYRISLLRMKGYDVTHLVKKLELIYQNLEDAKKFLETFDLENCSKSMYTTTQLLAEILLDLENIYLLTPRAYQKYFFYGIIVLIISAIIIVLLIFYYKRKKEERPKLLRGIETETFG